MTAPLPIYCSRNGCAVPATVEIEAGTVDTELRRAVACDRHRSAVRRWAARVGHPTSTPIDQPMVGQLTLFSVTEVEP
ncbi:hypothetical protein [Actinoplanes utahensis]|uniref:Uncharacterized protein n=1 Tax=Actinoplanes utahensis TaxID=1869 RepID=A0A0A6X8T6_ACTUT|nr:hypothetical protein [Actinoplanes utahensis]KHD76542.1 hypothetical protein MB27_16175 [Actinoplanes utahensis]GIF31219.1 hypothetical protein Aut01nite_42050 [Actinoplanes utahensis]